MKMVDYISGVCIVWPLLTLQVALLMSVYGHNRFMSDLSFMINRKFGFGKIGNYWTFGYVVFLLVSVIFFIFFLKTSHAPIYKGMPVSNWIYCKFKN